MDEMRALLALRGFRFCRNLQGHARILSMRKEGGRMLALNPSGVWVRSRAAALGDYMELGWEQAYFLPVISEDMVKWVSSEEGE